MSQPFPGIPERGSTPPFKRRAQPGSVQKAVKAALRDVKPYCERAVRDGKRYGQDLWRRGKRGSQDLWMKGSRDPRTIGIAGGALITTLVGAMVVSATGAGPSFCPPVSEGKTAPFALLMDPVPSAVAGSKIAIHYDVCGLNSGTPYTGKIRLTQQKSAKKAPKTKPTVLAFRDKVDGTAARREQEIKQAPAKAGTYTLELSVVDKQGRERKRAQKVTIRTR
jgi:hypothetical protein